MNAELMALGRRAIACEGWRGMPGMKSLPDSHGRVYRVCQSERGGLRLTQEAGRRLRQPAPDVHSLIPDLSDPATLGCLLALVREAFQAPYSGVVWSNIGGWTCAIIGSDGNEQGRLTQGLFLGDTEAEALVAALEAAA